MHIFFVIIVLAFIQGITEFLPISSSGHLFLFQEILGIKENRLDIAVFLHTGSLIAIIIYYRKRLTKIVKYFFRGRVYWEKIDGKTVIGFQNKTTKYAYIIIAATIPAVVFGLGFDNLIENTLSSPVFIGSFFILNGIILFSSKYAVKFGEKINFKNGLFIGFAQCLAILPGISRSGSTITAGMHKKIDPEKSMEFSFMLGIIAIGGATFLQILKIENIAGNFLFWIYLFIGMIVSGVVSYFCLVFLGKILKKGKLHYFAFYSWILGIVTLMSIMKQ